MSRFDIYEMGRYTLEQNWEILKTYFQSGESSSSSAITVNGERYRDMLNEFLFPKIEEDDAGDIWFQQDGATCHTAKVTLELLATVFENRITSPNSDINWSPRSCDYSRFEKQIYCGQKVR